MSDLEDKDWLDQIDEFGLHSLIKLTIIVIYLLLISIIFSFLPGLDRLLLLVPILVPGIVRAIVTLAIVLLLIQIASRAEKLVHQLQNTSTENVPFIAGIIYWVVILVAILVAFEGFGEVGRHLLATGGVENFYSIFFAILASIPVMIILLYIAAYIRSNQTTDDTSIISTQIQSDQGELLIILEEHDGIVRQGDITEECEWSKTKVSRVLSDMEENGLILRYQLGREKVVCLPGREPEFVKKDQDEP